MTADELEQHLLVAGIECRVRKNEVQIEVCLFCGNDRYNLEANAEKGIYHCWACKARGRVESMLREVTGDNSIRVPVNFTRKNTSVQLPTASEFQHTPAMQLDSSRIYLSRRGITEEIARVYGLVVCTEPGHQLYGRIAIPVLDYWTQEHIGYVGRAYTNTRPKYLSTLPRPIITGWRVPEKNRPCIVVEGHFDGIAVHLAGYHAAVLGGIGVAAASEFAARCPPNMPLTVMLDGSAQEEARRLTAQFRVARQTQGAGVGMISLPAKYDPADFHPQALAHFLEHQMKTLDFYH